MPVRDSVKMSFDAASLPHIMQSLTNLYADPYLAILREYTMNARDSHIAANQKAPVQVTLPSRFEPTFIVQDQGVGMSQFEILDIYSKYGRSTKRDDMTQVGAFGLGSKCALSLVDQFSIIAVKDGERTIAIVSKTADGGGEVNIISAEDTTESNGVRVVVAIPNHERFNRNAEKFFLTWQKGTVLVGGEEPANIYGDDFVHYGSFHVSPVVTTTHIKRSIFLVIGGVSYEITDTQYMPATARDRIAYTAYIDVPIGAVDFTPARDTLRYTTRTRELIYKSVEDVEAKFGDIAQQDLDAQQDRESAVAVRLRWTARGYPDPFDLKWRGESIPIHLYSHLIPNAESEEHELIPGNMDRHSIGTTSRSSSVTSSRSIPLYEGNSEFPCIVVTGQISVSEMRLKAALRDISFDGGEDLDRMANCRIIYVLNSNDTKFSPWIADTSLFQVLDIQDVLDRSTEIRRSRRRAAAANRVPGESVETVKDANFSYEMCIIGKSGSTQEKWMTVKEIPLNSYYVDSPIAQAMTAAKSRYGSRRSVSWFADFNEGDHIILLPRGRMDSALFRRLSKLHGGEISLTSVSQKIARDTASISQKLESPVSIYFAARANDGYSLSSAILVILEMISSDKSMGKLFPEFVDAADFRQEASLHPHAFKSIVQGFNNAESSRKHRRDAEAILNKYVAKYPLIGGVTLHGVTGKEVLVKEMIRYTKNLQKEARGTVTSNTKER
jgi:hypothetical protein